MRNDFENKFNLLNQDRNVPHLLGIVGTKTEKEFTKSDLQNLKRNFGKMSAEQFDELFRKKQELVDLVSGGK